MSFANRFLNRAKDKPGARFLTTVSLGQDDRHFTYGQLEERARGFAAALAARGVAPNDVVLLFLKQSFDNLAAFLGAVLLGAIPSFMPSQTDRQDPAVFWQVNRRLFALIHPKALVFEQEFISQAARVAEALPAQAAAPLTLTVNQLSQPCQPVAVASRGEGDLLLLQHSSGTTGLKKGVMLSHGAVLKQLDRYALRLELSHQDKIASWLPLYHDMGLMTGFLLPLIHGVPLILLDPFEWALAPGSLLAAIERHRATLCWLPNFALNHICRQKRPEQVSDLSSMRAFINCSEPCRWDSVQRFLDTFGSQGVGTPQVATCYAMAEAVFAATQTSLGVDARPFWVERKALLEHRVVPVDPQSEGALGLVSSGTPLEGLEIAIEGEGGRLLADRQVGEICLRGDYLFSGYYRRAQSQISPEGWYHTGDRGFLHQGELYVLGRRDDMMICGGKNIYAHSVEAELATLPGISAGRIAAFGIFDEQRGTQNLVVVAESKLSEARERNGLRLKIIETISALYQLTPHAVKVVQPGWIVKTTSGKISRSANQEKWSADLPRA